jgi:hypothetical protein
MDARPLMSTAGSPSGFQARDQSTETLIYRRTGISGPSSFCLATPRSKVPSDIWASRWTMLWR